MMRHSAAGTPGRSARPSLGRSLGQIRLNRRGAAALEFAFAAPILLTFIIGIAQLGILFFANSGLKSAVGEGARYATIYPRPSDEQIIARINDRRFGLDPTYLSAPTITSCVSNGRNCIDIQVSYSAPVDFLFFQTPPLTLTERRRVFVQS